MNSLGLRVAAVKSGETTKKNAEMRGALVMLPKAYSMSTQPFCVDMRNAKNIAEQVAAVKNVFRSLGNDPEALQFVADLYFYCPPKHPVRNQILKLFITAARVGTVSGIDESAIVNSLANTVQRLLEETKADTESSRWNWTVASLSGCFENFDSGLKCLQQTVHSIFPFLCASLQKYLAELGVLSSPSVRNEYYMYLHSTVRLALSCVQEFGSALCATNAEQLKHMTLLCGQIVHDDEVPMDPRTNCGILMAQNSKLCGDYEAFIQRAKSTKNPNEIALCVGVVNTFDQHDFHCISADIRDICSKIEEMANTHATVPNILLCAARALYQISKTVLSFDLKTQQPRDDAKLILRKLLIFAFGYVEHHMDSVRHICRDMLRNIVAAARKIQFEFLLRKIFDACNSERLSLSMKCIVLQQTAAILGAAEITRNCTQLFPGLFAEYLGRDFIVNNLYEGLMSASHKELDFEPWFKQWVQYLLDIAATNDARLADVELIIVKAVKCEPNIVKIIIEKYDEERRIPISTKISALWAVRKSGIHIDNFGDIMQSFSRYLLLSILSNSDETRIMALRLLVETHKTTEQLTALECELLLTYFEYNANGQSPATRQKTLCLLSKALMRCELNLSKALKQQSSTMPAATAQNAANVGEQPLQLKFLQDVMRALVANLFPGANFGRRSVSLQLFEQCLHVCINCELPLDEMLPAQTIDALVATLADTYEANKKLAVNILKLVEDYGAAAEGLIQQHSIAIGVPQLQRLLTSVRPTDSMTAAYQLEFFCNRSACTSFGDFGEVVTYSRTYYAALRWLVLELKAGLKLAKQSILQAAKLNPLYGLLFSVKHMLRRLHFETLAVDIAWRILLADLIMLCKELTGVVAPVVNSSSPEGHLPNDFSALPAQYAREQAAEGMCTQTCKVLSSRCSQMNMAAAKATPQMVLLCAWRTVKEVSLILGDIVLRSPIQLGKLSENFLITKEQILQIGDHFKQLLAETKHRGAFEQAYVGFSQLCCRLWCVEASDLNSLPMLWLRELIAIISSRDERDMNEKICATRRSAGVPFMVQALITAELQVGTTKSLYFCMSHLFQLCAVSASSSMSASSTPPGERGGESRTHAFNILRALFRCTDLNETIGEFVSDGLISAIRGYEAATWSERNSATLLFAALVTRIFGVQRTKDSDNLNIRNKMTGRIFFLRYPKLYDFVLGQLQAASALVRSQQQIKKAHTLHPLLLILSRLYPSALEGTESNLKLSAFIPYISDCAGCPEMRTRYLAAKAVMALISKDAVHVTILRKCSEIIISADSDSELNLNVLHGQLLQILLLLRSHRTLIDGELIGDISCTVVTFYEKTRVRNAVISQVMLDIFTEIFLSLSNLTYSQETIQQLLYFSTQQELHIAELSAYYPVLLKSFFLYNLHALRLTLPFGALSDYLLSPPLTHASIQLEHAETCLNIILLVLLPQQTPPDVMTEFELSPAEVQFVSALSADTRSSLADELRQSRTLHTTLKGLVQEPGRYYPECATKAYAILSLLEHFDFTLAHLIAESKKHPGDVKVRLAMCVERLVLQQGIDSKASHACLEYLLDISQPWYPDTLRLEASQILAHLAPHYPKALEKKKLTFVRLYVGLILSLLMDDDYDIRDNTAKIVLNNLPDDIEMENVVATMALRLFLQATADILSAMRADDNYILDVFRVINETLTASDADARNDNGNGNNGDCASSANGRQPGSVSGSAMSDLEVFDRNEANVFAEPLKVIADCRVVFRNTFGGRAKVVAFVNDLDAC